MENGGMNKPFDAEQMKALVTYGAYHFENGIRTFADFSKRIIDDLGDWIEPHLKEAWTKIEEMNVPPKVKPTTETITSSNDKNENPSTENRELEQKSKDVGMVINPFIKKSLAIFIFLAIIISLFPPFEFGNEKLKTIEEREVQIFAENLPLKKYDFIFSNVKKKILLGDEYHEGSGWYSLHRELLLGELLIEYVIAFFVAIGVAYRFRAKGLSLTQLIEYPRHGLKVYFQTGRFWSEKR